MRTPSQGETELRMGLYNLHLIGPAHNNLPSPSGKAKAYLSKYGQHKDFPHYWGLRTARQGEDMSGFRLFLIFEQLDEQNQRIQVHATIPLKTLKRGLILSPCPQFTYGARFNLSLRKNNPRNGHTKEVTISTANNLSR